MTFEATNGSGVDEGIEMNVYQLNVVVSNVGEKDYSSYPMTVAKSKGAAVLKVLCHVREQRPSAVIEVKQVIEVQAPEDMRFITV